MRQAATQGTWGRDFSLSAIRCFGWIACLSLAGTVLAQSGEQPIESGTLSRVAYRNPGLVVDLGVGLWAWPLPMDYDEDGDMDLLVSCPDKPYNGTYYFENVSGAVKHPVFAPAKRLAGALANAQLSWVDGQPRILTPGHERIEIRSPGLGKSRKIFPKANVHPNKVRANQWKYADLDGDGCLDLLVGVGDWTDYGWDDAFDSQGRWTRGPLRGIIYWIRNTGTTESPEYAAPVRLEAGGAPLEVYGMPSPNLADFDEDGDLDLVCGEFLDGFTYFENLGSTTTPRFAKGRRLSTQGKPLRMDLQMITPVTVDWDADGDVDLICGDEDGRVALLENTGRRVDGLPEFLPPFYLQQLAEDVKFGALVTPVSCDWDGDGDEDLICGNTAGQIAWIQNISLPGDREPRWAEPRALRAEGTPIRLQAGSNGSIQGPCEAKWGYTTLSVADWDADGVLDVVANSIWGKVVWFRRPSPHSTLDLELPRPVQVAWPGAPPKPAWNWWNPAQGTLATQWRTTPFVMDLNRDGLSDLVMLDHQGYLAYFRRVRQATGELVLEPGKRIFYVQGHTDPLRLNDREAGRSGRRKLCLADLDGDGQLDLIVNSKNADVYFGVSQTSDRITLRGPRPYSSQALAGHTTSPTITDWNGDGKPELLIGAEDGYLYRAVVDR